MLRLPLKPMLLASRLRAGAPQCFRLPYHYPVRIAKHLRRETARGESGKNPTICGPFATSKRLGGSVFTEHPVRNQTDPNPFDPLERRMNVMVKVTSVVYGNGSFLSRETSLPWLVPRSATP